MPAELIDDAERVLAGVGAAGRRVGRIVEVDVAGRVGVDGEAQQAVRVDIELDQKVAAGGHDIGVADAGLGGEGDRPRIGEEQPRLAGLRIARAEMQVEGQKVELRVRADAGDQVQERLRVDVELQRSLRRGRDVGQVAAIAAEHDALQLVRECSGRVGDAVAARIDREAGAAGGERDRLRRDVAGDARRGGIDVEPADEAFLAAVGALLAVRLGEGQETGDVELRVVLRDGEAARLEMPVAGPGRCRGCCAD